jgi:hypothetical protein
MSQVLLTPQSGTEATWNVLEGLLEKHPPVVVIRALPWSFTINAQSVTL